MWTPLHFWALALRHHRDYRRAGVPMLPVVRGFEATARQILGYTRTLTGTTLVLRPVAGLGYLYLATVLGAMLVWQSRRLIQEPHRAMSPVPILDHLPDRAVRGDRDDVILRA